MKHLRILAIAVFVNCSAAYAGGSFSTIQTGNGVVVEPGQVAFTPAWQTLSIGSGGEMNNISHATSDDTMVAAQNTYGAYIRVSSGTISGTDLGGWGTTRTAPGWEQVFTQTSAPLTLTQVHNLQQGVNEIDVCNNNTNDAYAFYNQTLYSTTNLKAAASSRLWTSTGVTTTQQGNPGNYGFHQIACDPANPNVVWVSTPAAVKASGNGLNASPTFSTVTGIGTIGSLPDVIAFDATSGGAPTQACSQYSGSPTCTKHILIAVAGTGVYESYNGGSSFTLTTGGPTTPQGGCAEGTCWYLKADRFGNFWLANGVSTLSKYVPNGTAGGGTWSTVTPNVNNSQVGVFALDPTSGSSGTLRIAATYADGSISVSTNGGSTWCAHTTQSFSASGSQPGWIANANQNQGTAGGLFMQAKDMEFDNSGTLWLAGGIGMWKIASASVGCGPIWVADTVGIESLVSNHVEAPTGSAPVIAAWDRAFYYLTNPDTYPSRHWEDYVYNTTIQGVQAGWAFDYAAGTTTVTGWGGTTTNIPASSPNGGANSWAAWGSMSPATTNVGGEVAASTATNWLWIPAGNNGTLYFTTNGAASAWTASTLTGITGPISANYQHGFHIAADRVNANAFCLIDNAGKIFASTNSGSTWANNGSISVAGTVKYNDALKAVPGQSGVFYYSAGNAGGSNTGLTLYKITKTTNECDTISTVNASIGNIYGMGYGAPKPGGNGFPTIYFYGAVSSVQGLYEIDNGSATATLISVGSCQPSPTSCQTWPNNSGDYINDVSGDMNFYGRVYVGHNGSGFAYIDTQNACASVNWTTTYTPNVSLTGTVNLTAQSSGKVAATITGVSFYVDGSLIGTQTSGSSSGSPAVTTYTQSWNSGSVSIGSHTLTVSAINSSCPTSNQNYNSVSIPITRN